MTDASRKCREVEVYRTDDTLHTSITTNLPRLFYTTIQPIFTVLFPSPPFSFSFLFSSLVGSLSPSLSEEEKEEYEAEGDEAAHDDAVAALAGGDLADEGVEAGDLAGGEGDAAVDVGEGLALGGEVLARGVGLAQHAVDDAVRVVDARPLRQHVLGLGGLRVVAPVRLDVVAHVRQQVRPVARVLEPRPQPPQVPPVLRELLPQQAQVVLLQRRRRQARLRVEEPR